MKFTNDQIIKLLLKEKNIHLTGSRYWNKLYPELIPLENETDWDFVTEYCDNVAKQLLDIGFTEKNEGTHNIENYGDGTTIVVLYYNDVIQVIMKKNVNLYLKVINTVGVDFYKNYLWKRNVDVKKIQNTLTYLYGFWANIVHKN